MFPSRLNHFDLTRLLVYATATTTSKQDFVMASGLDPLKRKRARPSDWWVANATQSTPPQTSEPPLGKRDTKHLGGGGRTIKEVIDAVNRGKIPKPKERPLVRPKQDEELNKPTKRRRLSNTESGLLAKDPISEKKRRGRPPGEKEHGRAIAPKSILGVGNTLVPRVLQMADPPKSDDRPRGVTKKRRRVTPQADELSEGERLATDAGSAKPLRRGRSSNDGVELQTLITGSKATSRPQRVVQLNPTRKELPVPKPVGSKDSGQKGPQQQRRELSKVGDASKKTYKPPSDATAPPSTVKESAKMLSSKQGEATTSLRKPSSGSMPNPKRGRSSNPKASDGGAKEVRAGDPQPEKRARSKEGVSPGKFKPEVAQLPAYQHLTAVTRRVPRHTIESRWQPLAHSCIERISQFLHDIQRPVVVRFEDERKRDQASTALEVISRRLVGKLSKGLPFPPGTRNNREDDFDFEKILDLQRGFEAQLTPALHANELLQAEIGKENALLELEGAALADLEANARAEASRRKQAGRKLHSLLQEEPGKEENIYDSIGLDKKSKFLQPGLTVQDQHLKPILEDLNGHVDTVQSNLSQASGITEAIAKSKAAVQATMLDHLGGTAYEYVIMG